MAMAMNLAAGRAPALSTSDLHRIERRFTEIGHGFEAVPLEMPALRGADGRQDFPHFWLYPLLVVPALWTVDLAGAHPNHAFTILNVALAFAAFVLLVRHASQAIAILILAGPLIWWIDKAHGDVFTVSLLAVAFALLDEKPGLALVAAGAAAAQNPPLGPVFAVTLVFVLARPSLVRKNVPSTPVAAATRRRPDTRTLTGAATGAALALLPVLYYEWRLGVPTPILGWTSFHVPSVREAGAFLWDPNIGLALNDPVFVLTVLGAAISTARRRAMAIASCWMPLACAAILIAGFVQSVNINHGATPGMNRWTLWLTALAVPLLTQVEWRRGAGRILGLASLASLVWAVVFFQPARAEDYKTPTRTASWIWSHAPWLDNPPIEIFAERVSRAEPPRLPVATADCRKVLTLAGKWPVPCLPPLDPDARCAKPESACYANAGRSGYGFAPVRFPSGLAFAANARAWPLDEGFARHLRTALDQIGVEGLAPAASGDPGTMVRAAHRVAWTYTLQAADRLFVYLDDPAPDAVLTLRLPAPMAGAFMDLDTGERLVGVVRAGEPWAVWDVKVPSGRRHLALAMKRP